MKRSPTDGFSLVEVTLALGVAAFALVAIFGLLPIGSNSNQAAIEQTAAVSIATSVAADLRATLPPSASTPSPTSPQFGLNPASTGLQTKFFDDDNTVDATGTTARYRATVWCTPPTSGSRMATSVRLLVSWPAAADPVAGTAPARYSGAFETTIALDRN